MNPLSAKRRLFLLFATVVLLLPLTANAGITDIVTLLTTITSTLQGAIGSALSEIQTIKQAITGFEQQVVWPVSLINETRAEIAQVRSQFATLAAQIATLRTNSATLSIPKELETSLHDMTVGGPDRIVVSYNRVFQEVPVADRTTAAQRNLIDVDDALALEALKIAAASDQSQQQVLSVADTLEQETEVSAPGSAPILSAQAEIANLQNQALLQRLLAAELRQEAASLAHGNALRKQSAQASRLLRDNLQQTLSRPR